MANVRLPALVLCAANLLLIASLPRFFFRPGRLNAAWWLTAGPFALAGLTLAAVMTGLVRPLGGSAALTTRALPALAALLVAASATLIGYALGTHAQPVSLWHQADDTPAQLVTRGAYARIRHPFYAAFLLTLGACFLAAPHPLTLVALGAGVVRLNQTARREERRLVAAFGDAYRGYMMRTGRFLPRALTSR